MADLAQRIMEAAGQPAPAVEDSSGDGHLDDDVEIVDEDIGDDPDESEEDLDGDDTGEDQVDDRHISDDRGDTRGTSQPSVSRLVRNIGIKERELAQARQEIRQLQGRLQESQADRPREPSDSDDPIDVIEALAMRSLNVRDPSDPRVLQFVQDVARELTIHGFKNDSDREWTASREALQRKREERNRYRAYDRRVANLERERAEAEVRATRATLHAQTAEYLTTNARVTPLLHAAAQAEGFDPAQAVLERALAGVSSGEFPDPRDQRELRQLLGAIADSFETHYRTLAGKLVPTAGKSGTAIVDRKRAPERDARQRERAKGAQPAKTTTRGGGGRGRPAPIESDDSGGRPSLQERIERAAALNRRR